MITLLSFNVIMLIRTLAFLSTICLMPALAQAALFYEVDAGNDTITFTGSASGNPQFIVPGVNLAVWYESMSSSDNAGDQTMSFVSGSVDVTGNTINSTEIKMTSNGSAVAFSFIYFFDTDNSTNLTFNNLTYSYSNASAAQKSYLEDTLFATDSPITNTDGGFGNLQAIPEPGTYASVFGLAVIGLFLLRRRK